MESYFTADFFKSNRQRLRSELGTDEPIVVSANGLMQKSGDATYDFQQDSNFWYLTGIDSAEMILVMTKDREFLISPYISQYQNIFDGQVSDEQHIRRSGVSQVMDKKNGWLILKKILISSGSVATPVPSPAYIATYGMFTNPMRKKLILKLKTLHQNLTITNLLPFLAHLRSIKQASEINALQQAINTTMTAFELVGRQLRGLSFEYQAEAIISGYFLNQGYKNAWTPIIGSGPNSCILHSLDNKSPLLEHDVVVIDIGAAVEHYCADITRTYSLGNQPTNRQQMVYDAVKAVQDYSLSLQKPGALIKDNEKLTEIFMGDCLQQLGLINKPTHENIRRFFPHATSHFLGIDPHDAGNYHIPLQPGMVITVEPGIYIPDENIGVRIEDDILITDSGFQNLSTKLPRSLTWHTMNTK